MRQQCLIAASPIPPRSGFARQPARTPAARARTVLLVDPHDDTREIYGALLRHGGFHVLEASSGTQGARMARDHRPAVVVTELRLPELDGWSLLARIREDPALTSTAVLAVTAAVADVTRADALTRGFAELLPKPCTPQRVLDEVRRLAAK
ncbi:MAG: response regulator [Gemmatimonadetes bacterium]|nr:response regulator [Gemmatimonadota bacterium]